MRIVGLFLSLNMPASPPAFLHGQLRLSFLHLPHWTWHTCPARWTLLFPRRKKKDQMICQWVVLLSWCAASALTPYSDTHLGRLLSWPKCTYSVKFCRSVTCRAPPLGPWGWWGPCVSMTLTHTSLSLPPSGMLALLLFTCLLFLDHELFVYYSLNKLSLKNRKHRQERNNVENNLGKWWIEF